MPDSTDLFPDRNESITSVYSVATNSEQLPTPRLRAHGPHPLFIKSGFHPAVSTTTSLPTQTPAVASSALTQQHPQRTSVDQVRPNLDPSFRKLKSSRSVSEGLRNLREKLSRHNLRDAAKPEGGRPYIASNVPPLSDRDTATIRTSVRSAWTSNSSFMDSTTSTERSSTLTKNSSFSDVNKSRVSRTDDFSVEDAIHMYATGFDPSAEDLEIPHDSDLFQRPATSPSFPPNISESTANPQPSFLYRRSLSAANLTVPPVPDIPDVAKASLVRSATQVMSEDVKFPTIPIKIPRDRYGFKKTSQHVNLQDYDRWNVVYTQHLDRRWRKWLDLMRANGLSTEKPVRFPPPSDKVKRYIRKGLPPPWRGAAWFWYAGGPGLQEQHQGRYFKILQDIRHNDALQLTDREHIERDLDRTFPDNVRFKPDPVDATQQDAPETNIVRALRRLLQAFAVHNPDIGYCQSLNFIAGLLLLFLDEDEEKAFILLNVVTTQFLPGTHGVSLEGANIDIAVLMASLKETLPAIWAKLEDKPFRGANTGGPAPLPTVSLATTAWFMSLFVGTLPIESVLRIWDCLFAEGSKTLFRFALAIFKSSEDGIRRVNDPAEVFQVVQTVPKSMLDINGLIDQCFRRRNGFVNITQAVVERRRREQKEIRQQATAAGQAKLVPSKSLRGRLRAKTKGG